MPEAVTERLFYTVEKQQDQFALAQQEQIGGVTFDTSSSARIKSWKQAFEAVPTHPILGWGVTGWRFIDAQYLKVIVETGIVGLFAFLLMLYHILKNSWQTYKSGQDPLFQGVALGLFVGTLAMITHATMTNTFIIVRIMEPFCLLLAIVIGVPHLEETEKDQTNSASVNPRLSHGYSAGLKIQQGTLG
jgi:O-antigen ligase